MVKIYTDGSCPKNDGKHPGGWAAVIIVDGIQNEISGGQQKTTNNRMEMQAAISGLEFLTEKSEVEIFSDSAYLINCFLKGWYKNWQKNGWLNSQGNTVENKDLWETLLDLSNKHTITWTKVKGHSDNVLNNRCDELAGKAVPCLTN